VQIHTSLPTRSYPAKVILFGEYTVLLGGSILAVPYPTLAAKWEQGTTKDQRLIDYIDHLISSASASNIKALKVNSLHDLRQRADNGLILQSNLKLGAGLGSSGTVVAAIYDYCKASDDETTEDLLSTFVKMESYFHGESSGIDPLVSYTQSAVLKTEGKITLIEDITVPAFDLYDSNLSRDTKELVSKFKARLQNDTTFATAINEIKQVNDQLIQSLLDGKFEIDLTKQLSTLQLEVMADYITDPIKELWQADTEVTWKICGAGGGGYFLRIIG